MTLAREFRRPDWRVMLAGMSSSELAEWGRYYRKQYFEGDLLDTHFSRLSHLIVSMLCTETELTPRDFSLLNPPEQEDLPMDDDVMMSVAESLGGVRYGPVSG
ncbi:phage tail assembly protein T [Enterobacter asburiae]|uniref:phage tail assembly protein T n=1 Tax=Enterobacter asburiae TaxID=61645 RepID=UPI003B83DADC